MGEQGRSRYLCSQSTLKPVPSSRRQHGGALILGERVTMTIPSLVHAGSVIEPVRAPPLADASKKDTAVKSARACDGPSAIHSAELFGGPSLAPEHCACEMRYDSPSFLAAFMRLRSKVQSEAPESAADARTLTSTQPSPVPASRCISRKASAS